MVEFSSYDEYCKAFNSNDEKRKTKAFLMLCLRDSFSKVAEYDRMSGGIVPIGLVEIAGKDALQQGFTSSENDSLTYIINNFKASFQHISFNMRSKIIRENIVMPVPKVKEINTTGINWLSRKPGVTIKQKLSGGYKMMAVNRRLNLDTGENRLFMELLRVFEMHIERKLNCLPPENINEHEIKFYQDITKVLRNDALGEIRRWENLTPNNTLLSDRHYRSVWKAWLSLNKIDEIIASDSQNILQCLSTVFFVRLISSISRYCRLPQVPVRFDYDTLGMKLLSDKIRFVICNSHDLVSVSLKSRNAFWRTNEYGSICVTNIDGYGKTALYSSNFLDQTEFSTDCDVVSLKVEENKKRPGEFIAKNISCGKTESFIPAEISTGRNELALVIESRRTTVKFESNDSIAVEISQNGKMQYSAKVTAGSMDTFVDKFAQLAFSTSYKPFTKIEKSSQKEHREAVIEIYSVRPKYAVDDAEADNFPISLLIQQYQVKDEAFQLNVGNAGAVLLDKDVLSIRRLFESSSSQSAELFAEKVSEVLKAAKLTYILPDMFNEFQVTTIRKSINLYYPNSTAFPKSIGLVFHWQYSGKFHETKFSDEDFVLVSDLIDNKLTYTLLKGTFNQELLNAIPESCGIEWERHPTDIESCEEYLKDIETLLIRRGCDEAGLLLDIFGIDGVLREVDNLSVDMGSKWFHITKDTCEAIKNNAFNIESNLDEYKKRVRSLIKNARVHILLGTNTLKAKTAFTFHSDSAIEGYRKYAKRKSKVDFPLWRDHIPTLAIKMLYSKFDLLDNIRIEPQFGKVRHFDIPRQFLLPAKNKTYRLPLIIGDEKSGAQFEATLKSSAFPLIEEVLCKLTMEYRYGAEEPYTLFFEPLDRKRAGFMGVKAEWRRIEEYYTKDLPYPKFPRVKSWEDFQRYPDEKKGGTSDLLKWISDVLESVGQNKVEKVSLKSCGAHWKTDKNDKMFCFIGTENYGDVFFHEDVFDNKDEFSTDCDTVFFRAVPDRFNAGKYVARNIRFKYNPYNDFLTKFHKGSKFAFHTVFFNGRSVSEPDCPDWFREAVEKGIPKLFEAYARTTIEENKTFYLSLLCLMSSNDPENICKLAGQYMDECQGERGIWVSGLVLALGNLEYPEQKELLSKISSRYSVYDRVIPMLATALWKSEKMIYNLEYAETLDYFKKAVAYVTSQVNEFKAQGKIDAIGYRIKNHLEFMLAVFRLRELGYAGVDYELSLNNGVVRQAYSTIEDLTEIMIESQLELKSFVQIEVNKPEHYKRIPELLYALLIYITGKTGEGEINILGIDSESGGVMSSL